MTEDTLMQRQLILEDEMIDLGAIRYEKRVTKSIMKGTEATTTHGKKLVAGSIEFVAEALEALVEQYATGKAGRGRPDILATYLPLVGDYQKVAYITARYVINGISRRVPLLTVAMQVGRAIEDQVLFSMLAKEAPGYLKYLNASLKKAGDAHRKRVMRAATLRAKEITWDVWSVDVRKNIGIKCIEQFCIHATGKDSTSKIAVTSLEVKGKKQYRYIDPTPATVEWIKAHRDRMSMLPIYWPTILPPKQWDGPYGGGYYSDKIRPMRFIKTHNRNLLEELRNRKQQMQPVYAAINALQNTAWRVNHPVYEVMMQAWEQGSTLGDLPNSKDEEARPHPYPNVKVEDMTQEQLTNHKLWKAHKHEVYAKNAANTSKQTATQNTLDVARKFHDEEEFFFPYNVDFRGRVYPIPVGLQPQGDDFAKALLEFANGEPIETEEQADWLAIHGANLFGMDKIPMAERVMWAHMHTEQVMEVVMDPFNNRWWCEADRKKKWQFLAWCFEWYQFKIEGYGFVSHLPIAMDGSCNGLQHFSAMLRDPIGGKAVNLIPSEKPSDIYADVAAQTVTLLHGSDEEYAKKWLEWGISRKDTKRSVMIVPYSGTLMACKDYILERIHERIDKEGQADIWGEEKSKAAMFLAKKVWAAIDETVVAARDAMNWLQGVAKVVSKEELPINWTTPDGFVVEQAYRTVEDRRISTYVDGSIVPDTKPRKDREKVQLEVRYGEESDKLDANAQRNGIAPNFVHSLDATAMRMTVVAAAEHGVSSFAMIHDSFGTTAAQTPTLARVLREQFVGIYQQHDVLAEFQRQVCRDVECAPLPEHGTLEIEEVLQSPFFFA